MIPVSLSRSGCPRLVLRQHRKLFLNAPDSDRALWIARCYVTALGIYKIIVCDPGPVDLSSLMERFPPGFAWLPGNQGVRSRPLRFLDILKSGVPSITKLPLITGISDRVMWTAGPVPGPLCNSAYWREQAEASFSFFWRAPYELLVRSYQGWPGLHQFRRVHRDPTLLLEEKDVSWKVPVKRNLTMQRLHFAMMAILQDLYGLPDIDLSFSEVRDWVPEVRSVPPRRMFREILSTPGSTLDRVWALQAGRDAWTCYLHSATGKSVEALLAVGAQPMLRLASKIEPTGKVRVFTILDSLSQRMLEPLHEWFCDVLRMIPQDGTFEQLRPLRSLRGNNLYSIDLKSATDRMPAQITSGLISALFGPELSSLWLALMRREVSPGNLRYKGAKPPLLFAQGSPLGALSAWPAFALTHHVLVQDSARRAGLTGWFSNYAIVGDDLVVG